MKEEDNDEFRREETEFLLWETIGLELVRLRAAGMHGGSDPFWRELFSDDVCDYWND